MRIFPQYFSCKSIKIITKSLEDFPTLKKLASFLKLPKLHLPITYGQSSINSCGCRVLKCGGNQYWACKYNTIIGNHSDIRLNVLLKIVSFKIHFFFFNQKDIIHGAVYFKDNLSKKKKSSYHYTNLQKPKMSWVYFFLSLSKDIVHNISLSLPPNQNNSRSPKGDEESVLRKQAWANLLHSMRWAPIPPEKLVSKTTWERSI